MRSHTCTLAARCLGPLDRSGDNTHLLKGNVHCRTRHAWTPTLLPSNHESKGKVLLLKISRLVPRRVYIASIIFYHPDRTKKILQRRGVRLVAVVRERVPGATNGGNLSPTALRVLLAARPFFHPCTYLLRARGKGRILALAKRVSPVFSCRGTFYFIAGGSGWLSILMKLGDAVGCPG